MLSKSIMNGIAVTVTVVWVASQVAPLIPGLNYKADPMISTIFGALVGGAFMIPKLLGKSSDDEPGKHRKTEDGDD